MWDLPSLFFLVTLLFSYLHTRFTFARWGRKLGLKKYVLGYVVGMVMVVVSAVWLGFQMLLLSYVMGIWSVGFSLAVIQKIQQQTEGGS